MAGLGGLGVSAVKWSAVSTAGRFALQLVAQVILARTLGPDLFGVFAIGMVVLTFANFVSGFGFSWSLLQRKTVRNHDIRFAWTWQLIVGAAAMACLYLLAPYLGSYFREPRAQSVIEWLSLACLLSAAAAPATYLLQRDLNFRAVGLIQLGSYGAGYLAVGVPMALMGLGTAALVAAWLVQCAVVFIASYALKPHAIRPLFWYRDAANAMGTGRAVFLTNIVNWSLNNLDRVLIGRLLDAQSLGLYSVAYNLATMPNALLLGALQPAFLAAGAKLQDDLERLGRAYLQMVATVLVLGCPVFIFLALNSADVVRLLYGSQWRGAGWVLSILFLSMPAYVVWGLSTPVLWNTGRKYFEFGLQLPVLLLGALAFYGLAARGIRTAAVVAALLLVLRAVVICIAALQALGLRRTVVLQHIVRGLSLGALCAASVTVAQQSVLRFDMPALSIATSTLAACSVALLIVKLRPQLVGDQTADMMIRFFPRLAGVMGKSSSTLSQGGLAEQRL